MITVLLVHGAWHRPEVWDRLRAELETLGYPTATVNLPSAGPDPRGGLAEDAGAVRAALDAVDGPVAVVAHSYGGIPVTEGAAGHDRVRHLVYLAAYQLDRGESMFAFHGAPEPADTEGLFPVMADPRNALYGDLPDADAEHFVGRLVEQRLQAFADRVGEPAWRSIPSTYVVAEQDRALPVAEQERMAARAKDVRRLPSSHSPFLSMPGELAALLDDVLSGGGARR